MTYGLRVLLVLWLPEIIVIILQAIREDG